MKKLLKIFFCTISMSAFAQQGFYLSVGTSIPFEPSENYYKIGIEGEGGYLFSVSEDITVGPDISCVWLDVKLNTLDKKYPTENVILLPISMKLSYEISNQVFLGMKCGYSFDSDLIGGVLVKPSISYKATDNLFIQMNYQNISREKWPIYSFGFGLGIVF